MSHLRNPPHRARTMLKPQPCLSSTRLPVAVAAFLCTSFATLLDAQTRTSEKGRCSAFAFLIFLCMASACRDNPDTEGSRSGIDNAAITLDSSEVSKLAVQPVASISLKPVGDYPILSISSLQVVGNDLYFIDSKSTVVHGFGKNGNWRFSTSLKAGRRGPGALIALALRSDTIFVADMNPAMGITMLSRAGKIIGNIDLQGRTTILGMVATPDALVLTHTSPDSVIRDGRGDFLSRVGTSGELQPFGCTPDPLYAESLNRGGFYGKARFTGVAMSEDGIYCRQPVTPIVRRFTFAGDTLPSISLVPPFYMRGEDRALSMNQLELDKFDSHFTEHLQFYRSGNSFLSVYSIFDQGSNVRYYPLFRCTRSGASGEWRSCAIARMPKPPLAFLAPDTVITAQLTESEADSLPMLKLSVLR